MPKQNLRSLSNTHYLPSRSLVSTKQKFYYRRNLLLKLKYTTHPDKIVGLIFFTTYHQKLPSGSKNFLYCVASLFSLILGKRYHSHHKPFKPAPYAQIHIHPHTNTHTCTYKSTPYHVRTASSSGEGEGKQQAFFTMALRVQLIFLRYFRRKLWSISKFVSSLYKLFVQLPGPSNFWWHVFILWRQHFLAHINCILGNNTILAAGNSSELLNIKGLNHIKNFPPPFR